MRLLWRAGVERVLCIAMLMHKMCVMKHFFCLDDVIASIWPCRKHGKLIVGDSEGKLLHFGKATVYDHAIFECTFCNRYDGFLSE